MTPFTYIFKGLLLSIGKNMDTNIIFNTFKLIGLHQDGLMKENVLLRKSVPFTGNVNFKLVNDVPFTFFKYTLKLLG